MKNAYQIEPPPFVLSLIGGVLIGWLTSTLPSPFGWVVAGIFLLGATILVWRYALGQMQTEMRISLFATLMYFGIAVYITPLVNDYYARQGGSDVGFYIARGKELEELIFSNSLGATDLFVSRATFETNFKSSHPTTPGFQWIITLLLLLTGGSTIGVSIACAWLGAKGGYYFIKAFQPSLKKKDWLWYAILILFFPSVVLWLTFPLKDAITFWTLGLMLYGFSQFATDCSWSGLARLLVAELACFAIRPYFAAFFSIPFLAIGLLGLGQCVAQKKFKRLPSLLLLVAVNSLLFSLLTTNKFFIGIDSPQQLGEYQQLAGSYVAGSNIRPNIVVGSQASRANSFLSVLAFWGERIQYIFIVMFRPMPWESQNLFTFLASLENVVLLMLTVCILGKTRDVITATLQSPTLVFSACFIALFVGAFSLQVINLGTMNRLKINVLPFFFAFAAVALPRYFVSVRDLRCHFLIK
jgi:hypothetical protein